MRTNEAQSRDAYFISRLAMRRAVNVVDLMGLLPQFHDPQSELLLLRSCKGVILPSPKRELNLTALSKRRDVWPRGPNLGCYKTYVTVAYVDTATSKAQQTPTSALFSEMVKDMEVHFDMTACLDSFGEHAVHCKELTGFKYRHDMVRDVLFDVCRRAGISAKETHVNFLTGMLDGRSILKPADILIFEWVRGKHSCVDLTGFLLIWV
nr:reverse transcriptase domain, reverse transcriptase zinc-binding domain protein [Tanacetum cinerariifolium]